MKHKERQQERKRRTKELRDTQTTMNKIKTLNIVLSLIILNVNELNTQIKWNRNIEKTKKHRIQLYAIYNRIILDLRTCKLKVKVWENIKRIRVNT
jgi:hypothetical protein